MRSKPRTRRTAALAIKAASTIVGAYARAPALPDSPALPDDAVSAYEREIDRLDAAVQERI